MEYFKQFIENWIFSPLQLVLYPSSQDDPKVELKEKLEETLRNIQEVQTAVTQLNENLELVSIPLAELNIRHFKKLTKDLNFSPLQLLLHPSSPLNPSAELKEKLEEMTRKTQTFQTSLAMAALDLKEKLALVLDPSSQDNSIA